MRMLPVVFVFRFLFFALAFFQHGALVLVVAYVVVGVFLLEYLLHLIRPEVCA